MDWDYGAPGPQVTATRERWIVLSVFAGVATFLAVLETSRNYFGNALAGYPMPWLEIFATSAPSWTIMALLTPLPLAVARRVPVGRLSRGRTLTIHLAAAGVFAIAHTTGMALYMSARTATLAFFGMMLLKFSGTVAVSVMVYAAIAGIAHALRFYRDARAREVAASKLEASLSAARLAALRGQINPHFLFNTLNAISTMALSGDQDNVVRTLAALGELLRISLDDRVAQEVPLGEELSFLARYIDIQRIRLGDRLSVEYDISPATLDALVPSMLLQPLVENAVTHGIAKIPGPGFIRLKTSLEGGMLRLEITDSGPGFQSAMAPAHRENPAGEKSGIGLTNTRARLAQLYGTNQRLALGTAHDTGASVSVTIPYRLGSKAIGGAST